MQPGGVGTPATVVITGNRAAVETAALLVNTQLQFERKLSAERKHEDELMKKLTDMDIQYGDRVRGDIVVAAAAVVDVVCWVQGFASNLCCCSVQPLNSGRGARFRRDFDDEEEDVAALDPYRAERWERGRGRGMGGGPGRGGRGGRGRGGRGGASS